MLSKTYRIDATDGMQNSNEIFKYKGVSDNSI